ncbi:ubiquinone/menaquinone biosynthesis C-methylase UbiE [Granulicella aggregans]|uniref:Ubiquinone/menaquinone biosynthesis C-methylase UbiE n=1 Tax=Granulicella aggregans TaxID=474949 RepID=A0A7W7ZI45_9BACT|nr:class I SAM-dependent methyltransferase [Granulicella aggregans]MBB5060360.1 ubiquinone/menaquinone biosynthesis C-methylase UbiE [Granulicella aggregans]
MRLSTVPENPAEWVALMFGQVPTPLCDVIIGPMLAKAVIAASSLGIFDALEQGPLAAGGVASRCETDPDATERLLRALSASKYLHESYAPSPRPSLYRLTRASRRWLLAGADKSLHYAMLHRELDMRFMEFGQYVRTGRGQDFHSEMQPEDWYVYHQGQADQARLIAGELVSNLRLPSGATEMLDIGGGHGLYSLALCTHYPHLHARVLDLAIPLSGSLERTKVPAWNQVTFVVADARSIVLAPSSADVVLIANLMHHFDEKTNRCLVQRVAGALKPGGILVAMDLVRRPSSASGGQITTLMDLYFGAVSGAQLWELSDIRAWQEEAGLCPERPVSFRLLPDCKIQIARKPAPTGK